MACGHVGEVLLSSASNPTCGIQSFDCKGTYTKLDWDPGPLSQLECVVHIWLPAHTGAALFDAPTWAAVARPGIGPNAPIHE